MQVYQVEGAFGLTNLKAATRPDPPQPGPGQVLLKMTAASLNFRDWLMIEGQYNPRQPLPLVPCSDGVGTVTAVGPGVRRVKEGQRVATAFFERWVDGPPTKERLKTSLGGPIDGVLQQYMLLHEDGVVAVPEHLTDAEAACLPCAAVTAWSALVTHGQVKAGDTVLLQGTGGVSTFALQFAKALGATVIITSSSDQKLQRAADMGADHTINYKEDPKWGKTAAQITGGRGVDVVVEVGGAGTLASSLRAVRPGGTISLIGVLSGGAQKLAITSILMRQIRVQGVIVGTRATFEEMNRAIAAHQIRPVIDTTFELANIHRAFEHMAAGRHMGKICLAFPQ